VLKKQRDFLPGGHDGSYAKNALTNLAHTHKQTFSTRPTLQLRYTIYPEKMTTKVTP
jgi:hypothetical protein